MRSCAYLLVAALVNVVQARSISECACGYEDVSSGQLYTDAIIVYFNESQTLPADVFLAQDFTHKSEKGWNSVYKQGALPDNVQISNVSQVPWLESAVNPDTLELFVDPSTKGHLVNGGSVKTKRQDILHGTFRASMRSPHPWNGGTALSMMLRHNDTSSFEMDLCNMDDANSAAVTQLVNSEYTAETWPQRLNYSTLEQGSIGVRPLSPWDFMDLQVDWTKDFLNFSIAGNRTRSVRAKSTIPTEPLPLIFKHWSTGDTKWMQGPPVNRSVANIAWVRAFFNSSLTTSQERKAFDSRCQISSACSVDDITLRGSTNYSTEALLAWKEPPRNESWQLPSAIVSGSGAFIGFVMLLNVFLRKAPWGKFFKTQHGTASFVKPAQSTSPDAEKDKTGVTMTVTYSSTLGGSWAGESVATAEKSPNSRNEQSQYLDMQLLRSKMTESTVSHAGFAQTPKRPGSVSSDGWSSVTHTLVSPTPVLLTAKPSGVFEETEEGSKVSLSSPDQTIRESRVFDPSYDTIEVIAEPAAPENPFEDEKYELTNVFEDKRYEITSVHEVSSPSSSVTGLGISAGEKGKGAAVSAQEIIPEPAQNKPIFTPAHNPPAKKRIDYLAGLVTISCFGVTFIHFTLTFIPFAGGLSYGMHYKSEYWARWTISPIILDPIWLGPMFVTSCRFLVDRYLRNGNISDLAQKTLLRAPRMLIPCLIIATLEYFLIEEGFTAKLQWLPSVSWSTWPYVSDYPNFGWFLNETLELAYLIPNKAPGIVSHYCVGVLWTVPVQLQFSYTCLLAAVMVREIKRPWKRMCLYVFCIVNNWYALSWGSCFWLGVMLADLQLSYKYNEYIMARPRIQYPFLALLWCIVIAAPLFSLLEDRLHFPIMTYERGWHPDPATGLATSQTLRRGYPAYYEPRLNTLMFAGGLQAITECSVVVQKFLSWRPWIWVFPHTFTIYLIHGFVFWSLGAWLVVALADAALPYWAVMLVNFVCCYAVIGLAAVVLTPVCEGAAQAACRNLWRWAAHEPVPKRPTLSPYPRNLFLAKSAAPVVDVEGGPGTVVLDAGVQSKVGGKGRDVKGAEAGSEARKGVEVGVTEFQ